MHAPKIGVPGDAAGDRPRIAVGIEPLADREALGVSWRALEARADAAFALSWIWMRCWLELLDRPPLVLSARLDGRLVGLALLALHEGRRHRLLPVTSLHLHESGDPGRDIIFIEDNDVLAERGLAGEVRAACLAHLAATQVVAGQRWDELHLSGIGALVRAAAEASGLAVRVRAKDPSARVDLDAIRTSGRPYLEHLSANTRRQIRRAIALYEARGPLRLEPAGSVDEALAFFEAAGDLHQRTWTARGEPGAFAHAAFAAFHRDLIRHGLDEGAVEVLRVAAGGEPLGYLLNYVHRGRVGNAFSGFRYEEDNRLRPGLVSHALAIEHHLEGSARIYDFMAGAGRYKSSLGQPGPDLYWLCLQRPHVKLRVENALRALRRHLRRSAPPAGAES